MISLEVGGVLKTLGGLYRGTIIQLNTALGRVQIHQEIDGLFLGDEDFDLQVIENWLKLSDSEYIPPSSSTQQTNAPNKCICDIFTLMNLGRKCGALRRERAEK